MNWAPIAQTHFPKKTSNACRKRHERLMERKNAENWDGVKLEDLARAYVESREMMWKIIADKVGEKWQHVETKVNISLLASLTSRPVTFSFFLETLPLTQTIVHGKRPQNPPSRRPLPPHPRHLHLAHLPRRRRRERLRRLWPTPRSPQLRRPGPFFLSSIALAPIAPIPSPVPSSSVIASPIAFPPWQHFASRWKCVSRWECVSERATFLTSRQFAGDGVDAAGEWVEE